MGSELAAIDIVRDSLIMAMKISFPILVAGVVIGLLIAIAQSVTQIQEQTLSMVPKLFAMITVAVLLLPWIVAKLMDYAAGMLTLI